MFVVGISRMRPETRAFVTERTWAYQTKSAFSDAGYITLGRLICNGSSLLQAGAGGCVRGSEALGAKQTCAQSTIL